MSDTRLKLIKSANTLRNKQQRIDETIRHNLSVLAKDQDTTGAVLAENVTHILANIASTASEGQPLKLMHLNSIAAFMAGVESIANALPNAQDPQRVQNTLRVLQAASVGKDGFVTTAVAPIAQLGARKADVMSKYDQMVKDYMLGVSRGQPNGSALTQAARQLQTSIDQAMRTAASTNAPQASAAPAGPSSPGTAPSNV